MKRDIDLKDISDGRLYSAGDMARTDCRGCQGCSACCRGMGDTVMLDPMDVWRLSTGTGMDFTALIARIRTDMRDNEKGHRSERYF